MQKSTALVWLTTKKCILLSWMDDSAVESTAFPAPAKFGSQHPHWLAHGFELQFQKVIYLWLPRAPTLTGISDS